MSLVGLGAKAGEGAESCRTRPDAAALKHTPRQRRRRVQFSQRRGTAHPTLSFPGFRGQCKLHATFLSAPSLQLCLVKSTTEKLQLYQAENIFTFTINK